MTDQNQFKNFSTRRFRADLHYRMRLIAAQWGVSLQDAFNLIVEAGLDALERSMVKQSTVDKSSAPVRDKF